MLIGYAALSFAIAPASKGEIQLLPAGPEFRARDGRPKGIAGWKIDGAIAERVIARAAARKTPFVIDYEHQTLAAEHNGQAAPASGWFEGGRLEWREGAGLYAVDVAWTAKAKAHIDDREYKFISPVFSYDPKTGEVLQLQMAAITNNPGLDGMDAVVAMAQEFFTRDGGEGMDIDAARKWLERAIARHERHMNGTEATDKASQQTMMDEMRQALDALGDGKTQPKKEMEAMKSIIQLLGLAEDASEADITAAVTALKAKTGEQETQIAALKTQAEKGVDPAKFVPVETVAKLQGEIASLTTRLNVTELEDVIASAKADGKLLPAMEDWARDLGRKDIAALKSYVEKNPAIEALKSNQTQGRGPGERKDGELGDADLAVCRQMGVDPEAYKKTLQAAA